MEPNKNKRIIQSIFYMILASSLIAGTTILAKMLGTNKLGPALNPLQISNARFFFAFVIITIILLMTKAEIQNPNFKLHIARSLSGWIGISILFAGSSILTPPL